MPTQIISISNGMKLLVEEMPFLNSVTFGVYVMSGSGNETASNNGTAHAIEHMLFKGTKDHTAFELAKIMTDLGGGINAYTSKETTVYYARVLPEDFAYTVELLAEMIKFPNLSKSDFAKEKNVIIDEINSYDDSPEDVCHELLQKMVWKDNPLGYIISGSKTNVKKLTRDDLVAFMKANYTADNMIISVAGKVNSNDAVCIFERAFGQIQGGSNKLNPEIPKFNQVFLVRKKDCEQLHFNMAFEAPGNRNQDRFAMYLLNAHIGGNLDSLLFQKIREERGLTYNVYSYTNMSEDAGLFHIYASMNPEQAEYVYSLVCDIIKNLLRTGISEALLLKLKKQIKTELILGAESPNNIVLANARSYISNGRVISLDETLASYEAVTVEDCNRVLNKYITTSNCSVCLVGDIDDRTAGTIKKLWKKKLNRY